MILTCNRNEIRRFASACIIASVVMGLQLRGITARKPIVTPAVTELLIQEGEKLTIECQGENIQFSTEKNLAGVNQSEFFVTVNNDSGSYTFTRPNARGVDTGWYGCAEEGIEILNDEQTIDHPDTDIGWIYVYVNSSQPYAITLRSPFYRFYIPVMEGKSMVVPCRPTSPHLLMELSVIFRVGIIVYQWWRVLDYYLKFRSEESVIKEGEVVQGVTGQNLTLEYLRSYMLGEVDYWPVVWEYPKSVAINKLHMFARSGLSRFKNDQWASEVNGLDIRNVQKTDSGEYRCIEKDLHSNRTKLLKKFVVWVAEPGVITGEQVVHAHLNQTVELWCDAEGYPLTDFTWWKIGVLENEKLKEDRVESQFERTRDPERIVTTTTLLREDISREDNGTYECRARDYNGTISHRTSLIVHVVPEIRMDFDKAVGAGSVFLRWKTDEGNDPVEFYSVQHMKRDTEHWQNAAEKITRENSSYLITGLDKNTTYQFRITATNSIGVSQPANSRWITTLDEEPRLDTKIWIIGTTDTSITIGWSVVPAEHRDLALLHKVRVTHVRDRLEQVHVTADPDRYTLENLETGTKYAIRVASCSNYTDRCGNWSSVEETLAIDRDPKFIPNVSLVESTRRSIKIKWSMPPKELRERVHRYKVMATSSKGKNELRYVNKTENSFLFDNLEPSTGYLLKVAACSEYNTQCGNWSWEEDGFTEDTISPSEKSGAIVWLAVSSGVAILCIIIFVVVWMRIHSQREMAARRRFIVATLERENGVAPDCLDPALNMADQAEVMKWEEKWEFPRKLLKLGKVLGSGAFGTVMKGEASSLCRGEKVSTVAVKMVRATHRLDHMMALQRELKVLAYLGQHVNVVNLLGACTGNISYGILLVIVEYCRFGNLHDYLRSRRDDFVNETDDSASEVDDVAVAGCSHDTVTLDINASTEGPCQTEDFVIPSVPVEEQAANPDLIEPGQRSRYLGDFKDDDVESIGTGHLLNWAWQVSRGMKFLGTRRVLHGDLATRNILLADNNVVKICDFGLAKSLVMDDIYKKSGHGPLPVKWMAIESIRDRLFSVKSDVWSFGVVLWELFSLAETPYPGIANDSVYQKLAEGFRMAQPRYATEDLYNTMLRCWNAQPSKRPSFSELEEEISDLLDEGVETHYVAFDARYEILNAEAAAAENRDVRAPSTVTSSEESGRRPNQPSDDIEMTIRSSDVDAAFISPNSSSNQSL